MLADPARSRLDSFRSRPWRPDSMLSERQNAIMTIARSDGRVLVEALSGHFAVSVQTIRKDLNDLCDARLLSRIHGGAVLGAGAENLGYEARHALAAPEK